MNTPVTTESCLNKAMETIKDREAIYGRNGFEVQGLILKALFPEGITIVDTEDFNRWTLFNHVLEKLCRYGVNLQDGGHADSIHDLGVYSFILEAFDATHNWK